VAGSDAEGVGPLLSPRHRAAVLPPSVGTTGGPTDGAPGRRL